MINPSKSGWILKYLHLVEQGVILIDDSNEKNQQKESSWLDSGFSFGFCFQLLFTKNIGEEQWTLKEKFMVLYLEVFLSAYHDSKIEVKSNEHFLERLEAYAALYATQERSFWFLDGFIKSENNRTEDFIESRVKLLMNQFDEEPMEQISGAFGFLDAQLFLNYISKENKAEVYDTLKSLLQILIFLSSQKLPEKVKEDFEKNAEAVFLYWGFSKDEAKLAYLELHEDTQLVEVKSEGLSFQLRFFLLEYAIYYTLSDSKIKLTENKITLELAHALDLEMDHFERAFLNVEYFLQHHENELKEIKNQGVYGKVVEKINTQWSKLVLRNKDKLVVELKESSELVSLVKKSMIESLTAEEKLKVKSQFKDIVKSVPSLAIFMLPGGAFLLPFILKVIPDLLPSAFKDNEIPEK